MDDYILNDPPSDSVSSLRFSPSVPNLLVSGSWDGQVRLYDCTTNEVILDYLHSESAGGKKSKVPAAVLDCLLTSDGYVYSSALDRRVVRMNTLTLEEEVVCSHSNAVKAIEVDEDKGLLFSGCWDKKIRASDVRESDNATVEVDLPAKVFSMSFARNLLVVGMSERLINLYDIRNMKEPYQRRESPMKFQTRCVRMSPNADSYAVGSIEGRVAIEVVDPSPEAQAKKFAFKCHRVRGEDVDTVYPVHAVAYHPTFHTFATGGGDGVVNVWDGEARKRIRQFPKYEASIGALEFNCDGSLLAIASSYQFEEGDRDHPPDNILVKPVIDSDFRPKSQ